MLIDNLHSGLTVFVGGQRRADCSRQVIPGRNSRRILDVPFQNRREGRVVPITLAWSFLFELRLHADLRAHWVVRLRMLVGRGGLNFRSAFGQWHSL